MDLMPTTRSSVVNGDGACGADVWGVSDEASATMQISFVDMQGLFIICGLICAYAVVHAMFMKVRYRMRYNQAPAAEQHQHAMIELKATENAESAFKPTQNGGTPRSPFRTANGDGDNHHHHHHHHHYYGNGIGDDDRDAI